MLQLHDRTRRRICIAAFLLLCLAPTALTVLCCAARHWPGHVEAEARQLSRLLGLEVTLGGLRHLRPGQVLYEGLQMANAETGQQVLRCRTVEANWNEVAGPQAERKKPCIVLLASQAEIEAAGLDCFGQLLQRTLQGQGATAEVDVRLTAGNVTLKTAEGSQTLADFQASIERSPGGVQARIAFRPAGVDTPDTAKIYFLRNRQTTPPASGFELDTGSSALPCELLALGLPELKLLGPRSRLRGYLKANESPRGPAAGGWDGELVGQLFDIDLGRLVSEHFPHKLSGTAQVTIQSAHFRQGRLEDLTGTLSAGPGVISRSLIEAACARLNLRQAAALDTPGDLVPYEELMLAVLMDSGGLRLQGRCSSGGPGTILSDRRGRLLGEPAQQPQPVVALLQTLVPLSEVQVPATRQTDWLMRHLPVPQVVPPSGTETAFPHGQLRLGGTVRK